MEHLYAVHIVGTDYVKLGFTRGDLERRVGALKHSKHVPVAGVSSFELVASYPVARRARTIEQALHRLLAPYALGHEWFLMRGFTAAIFEERCAHALLLVRDKMKAWEPKPGRKLRMLEETPRRPYRLRAKALHPELRRVPDGFLSGP
jgi:Meiotically up-regulated gene 113